MVLLERGRPNTRQHERVGMMQLLEHQPVRQQAGKAHVRSDAGGPRVGLEGVTLRALADNSQVHPRRVVAHDQAEGIDQMGKAFFGTQAANRDQSQDAVGTIDAIGADRELAQIKSERQHANPIGRAPTGHGVIARVVRVGEHDVGALKRRAHELGVERASGLASVVVERDTRLGIDAANRHQVSRRCQIMDEAQIGSLGGQQHTLCSLNDFGAELWRMGSRDGGTQPTWMADQRARQRRLGEGEARPARRQVGCALGQSKACGQIPDIAPRPEREKGQRMAFHHELRKLRVEIRLERVGIVLRESVDSAAAGRGRRRRTRDFEVVAYAR